MEQWRVVLAFILSVGVLVGYSLWFSPKPVPAPVAVTETQPAADPTAQAPVVNPVSPPPALGQSKPASQIPAQEMILENKEVRAVLSTKGGVITHWELKEFNEGASKDTPRIDLLNHNASGKAFVLSLGEGLTDADLVYEILEENKNADTLTILLGTTFNNFEIRKRFTIHELNPHLMDVSVAIVNRGQGTLTLEPKLWIGREQKIIKETNGFLSFLHGGQADYFYPIYLLNDKFFQDQNWKEMAARTDKRGMIQWSALTDRYFLLSLISRQGTEANGVEFGKKDGNRIEVSLSYGNINIQPNAQVEQTYSAYFGPKKRDVLKGLGVGLEKSVDYGWLSFVAIPLLWLLIFFESIIPNWGIAIILLTFFVKLLLHPINKKSLESMREMQRLQPKLKEIREKFKNDRERLNMEMMQIFKVHKVNPMGGCLPMLVQLPVYFALYKVLWNAIELYHAPFFAFYQDLSAPDPYFVAPVLLGVLMYFQQKYTPQAASVDPAQQKIMLFMMPIMFTSFMLFLPFGLVLYILVNTLISFLQQYMMFKEVGDMPGKKTA